MHLLIPILVTLVGGIILAVQPPTNAMLARASGSVILAALVSFVVGTAAIAAIWLAGDRTSPTLLKGVPAWAWLGGLYGAFYVGAAAYAAPRLGVASMLTIAIASQLMAALVLDHFGLLGLDRTPVTATRLGGVLLVLLGVVLVRRG